METTSSSASAQMSAVALTAPPESISSALRDDVARKDALASYAGNKKLSKDELALVKSSGPNEIILFIEDTKTRLSKSKYAKVVKGVRICIETLNRHRKSLDFFAQARGMPGCLAWGIIRVALQVLKKYLFIFQSCQVLYLIQGIEVLLHLAIHIHLVLPTTAQGHNSFIRTQCSCTKRLGRSWKTR